MLHNRLRVAAEAKSQELNDFELLAAAAEVFPTVVDTRVEEFPGVPLPPVVLQSPAVIAELSVMESDDDDLVVIGVQGTASELAMPCAEGL